MNQLRHILAATDLSDLSLRAVARGFMVAKTSGARYTVLHALGLDALAAMRDWLGARVEAVSRKLVDEVRDHLRDFVADPDRNLGVTASVQVEDGLAGAVIPAWIESSEVDLAIIGAHGSGFLQRVLLGSTASHLLHTCRCPVLVVKREARSAYHRALVAVDFSPCSETAIRLAREVAPDADILLLHIFEVPFERKMQFAGVGDDIVHQYRIEARERAVRQLHELAKSAGLSETDYTGVVLYGDATRQIVTQEEKYRCDLIVMGKHGTRVTEELLLGSVTNRVLAESAGDVLVVVDKRMPEVLTATA